MAKDTDGDLKIVEGRNLWQACFIINLTTPIMPQFEVFDEETEGPLEDFIAAMETRRHDSKFLKILEAAAKATRPGGGVTGMGAGTTLQNLQSDNEEDDKHPDDIPIGDTPTVAEAAADAGVSPRTLASVKAVNKNGCPVLIAACEAEDVKYSDAAKILEEPAGIQPGFRPKPWS